MNRDSVCCRIVDLKVSVFLAETSIVAFAWSWLSEYSYTTGNRNAVLIPRERRLPRPRVLGLPAG